APPAAGRAPAGRTGGGADGAARDVARVRAVLPRPRPPGPSGEPRQPRPVRARFAARGGLVAHPLPRPLPDHPDPRARGTRRSLARPDQPAPEIGADAVTDARENTVVPALDVRDLSVRLDRKSVV